MHVATTKKVVLTGCKKSICLNISLLHVCELCSLAAEAKNSFSVLYVDLCFDVYSRANEWASVNLCVWRHPEYSLCLRNWSPLFSAFCGVTSEVLLQDFDRVYRSSFCLRLLSLLYKRGADKSLAWPGRKQATATKLGIYSTYSTRSSIHFLARFPNFCKALKKKFRRLSVEPGLRGSNDLRVGRKMAPLQLFFHSREQVVVRLGQIRRIGRVIKILEAQVRHVVLACKCPVIRGIVQEQDPLGDLPAAFFLQNVLQLHRQR